MTRNSRRHNNLQSTLKDYLVPIIGGILILMLIYSFFNGGSSTTTTNTDENRVPTEITFGSVDTQAFINYPGNTKEEITEANSLYKGETIIVKQGTVSLSNKDGTTVNLNKIAELKYAEDGSYSLYSSDAWFNLGSDTSISMKFANIQADAGSVLSLTQNEAGSTIYVLAGSAKVSNLSGVNTLLIKGQKVSISRLDAASKDIDLENEKTTIDSYFKGSDWFIENGGHIIITQEDTTDETLTEDSEDTTTQATTGKYISFENLRDEMSLEANSLNVKGSVLSEEVGGVTINNRQASISADKGISLEALLLGQTVNDVVVKIYNTNKNIIQKQVYTVYTSGRSNSSSTTPNTAVTPNSQGVTTYNVDATDFTFTQPSNTGKFSTTGSEITIRGATTAKGISRVEVNGFKLSSFNGSTWRYHAFERFETLEAGTNQYRVDYFGEDGNIVYTDYYTIVKKAATTESTPEVTQPVISTEANPQ